MNKSGKWNIFERRWICKNAILLNFCNGKPYKSFKRWNIFDLESSEHQLNVFLYFGHYNTFGIQVCSMIHSALLYIQCYIYAHENLPILKCLSKITTTKAHTNNVSQEETKRENISRPLVIWYTYTIRVVLFTFSWWPFLCSIFFLIFCFGAFSLVKSGRVALIFCINIDKIMKWS